MDNNKKIEHYGWQAPDITPKIDQFPTWGQPMQMETDRFKNEEPGVETTMEGEPQTEAAETQAPEQGGPQEQPQTWDWSTARLAGDDTPPEKGQAREEPAQVDTPSEETRVPNGFDFSEAADAPAPEEEPASEENIQRFGWGITEPSSSPNLENEQEDAEAQSQDASYGQEQLNGKDTSSTTWPPQTHIPDEEVTPGTELQSERPRKKKKRPAQKFEPEPFPAMDETDKPPKKKKSHGTEPALSKQEKKLQKKSKKEHKENQATNKEKSSNGPMVLVRLLVCACFAVFVVIQGLDRIETAKALVGSTDWDELSEVEDVIDIPLDEPNDEHIIRYTEYQYISVEKLDEKTSTDLAVWYLTEFPDGKPHNENALAEFEDWLMMKGEEDPEFKANYDEALVYVREHPEILNPPEPEKPKEDEQVEEPTTPTTEPDTISSTTPSTGTETGDTTPTNPSGTETSVEESRFTSIKESEMNAMTAAQVANWVQQTFPSGQTGWDYTKLTEFYEWLDTKDDIFVSKVNGFLEVSGWSGSIT